MKAIPVPTDITDLNALKNLVTTAEAELGGIDVLVNNAALDSPIFFEQERPEVIEQIMATNLTAPMLLTQLVLPGRLLLGCPLHSNHFLVFSQAQASGFSGMRLPQ